MINVIISVDPSTRFLYGIVEILKLNSVKINLIEIYPTDSSYEIAKTEISNLDKGSNILFLGHGRDDKIYGGECLPLFEKKSIVDRDEMKIFEGQKIFVLACNSSDLLKSTFTLSKYERSLGFGSLPTSEKEVSNDKKLSLAGISTETIEKFKTAIIETVSNALLKYLKEDTNDFYYLKDYLILLIDKKINFSILEESDRNLGDLLFNMRNEILLY